MAARPYYLLLERDDSVSPWCIAFGAYERDDVTFERDDYRNAGRKAANLRVVRCADSRQSTCNAAVAALNAESAPVSDARLVEIVTAVGDAFVAGAASVSLGKVTQREATLRARLFYRDAPLAAAYVDGWKRETARRKRA